MQERFIGFIKHRLEEVSLVRDGSKFIETKTETTKAQLDADYNFDGIETHSERYLRHRLVHAL